MILDIASSRMIKALVDIGYLEELYKTEDFEKLRVARAQICADLLLSVFNEDEKLDKTEWLQRLEEQDWLFSFQKIRKKIFKQAKVKMHFVSEAEAEKHFKRMEDQQQKVKEKAEKEELKRKEKEETVLTFLQKHKGDFEKLKEEIEQPDKNQKQERFRKDDKFALVLSNKTYDTSKTTMKDLPAV